MSFPRSFAISLWALAAVGIARFPFAQAALGAATVGIALVVAWRPRLLYAALALIIPTLDLTPWSGRWWLNEFDFFLMAAIGGTMWSLPARRPEKIACIDHCLMAALAGCYAIGVATTLLAPYVGESMSPYHEPLNALRIAKPLLYAAAVGLYYWRSEDQPQHAFLSFSGGCLLGLTATIATVVLERLRFCGLVDLESEFRVTGPFADMHIGGAQLDSYLVMSIPLVLMLWGRRQTWWWKTLIGLTVIGGTYTVLATLSRTPIAVLAVQLACLGGIRLFAKDTPRFMVRVLPSLAGLLLISGLVLVSFSSSLRERFAGSATDAQSRVDHWCLSLNLLESSRDWFLGIGCGAFPKAMSQCEPERAFAGHQVINDSEETYLRLRGGPMYLGQYVNTQPNQTYSIVFTGRLVEGETGLTTSLVEKNLLHAYESVSHSPIFTLANSEWTEIRRRINTGDVGRPYDRSPLPAIARPVVFSLWTGEGTVVDIRQVELFDENGNSLIENGDFSRGHDRWWWTSDQHLIWHTKSMPVHLLVEHGVLGLTVFGLVSVRVLWLLATFAGLPMRSSVAMSLAGFFAMGVIDTQIDSPRILLFFLLICGYVILSASKQPMPKRADR